MTDPAQTAAASAARDSAGPLEPTATLPDGTHRLAPPQRAGELGTFGRYRVLQKLGHGGMGAVYLGFDPVLDRKVALKVMLPQYAADAVARERFLREARTAAQVRSDHVVTIHDVDEQAGMPFIAMEYLLGMPLDRFLKTKGELPLEQVVRVGRETALGLFAVHELGLVHRDVKPANIWLEAPKGRVKLLDFGLARAADDDEHLTGEGAVLGTVVYMSPEQGRGLKVDHRTDLWSLGVMLYRLCTGKLPFKGTTPMATLTCIAIDAPVAPRAHNPDLPEAVEQVILTLLAKEPAARFQTAAEVVAALGAAVAAPPPSAVAAPESLHIGAQTQNVWDGIDVSESVAVPLAESAAAAGPKVPSHPRTAPKWPLAVAAVAALAAGAAVAAVLWPRKPPDAPPPPARKDDPPPPTPILPNAPPGVPSGTPGKVYPLPPNLVAAAVPVRPEEVFALDHLDPADPKFVPPGEKFPWQPKELVAVIGSHRLRMPGIVNHLAFAADGRTVFAALALGSAGPLVEAFDAASGERVKRPPLTSFSADGKWAAGGKRVYDLSDPNPAGVEYVSLPGPIVAPLGAGAALVEANGTLGVWKLGDKPAAVGPAVPAVTFALSPDRTRLVAAGADGRVAVYALSPTIGLVKWFDLPGDEGRVRIVTFTFGQLSVANDGRVALADVGGAARVWDTSGAAPKLTHSIAVAGGGPWDRVALLGESKLAVATEAYLLVRALTPSGVRPVGSASMSHTSGGCRALAASPDGRTLSTGHASGAVRLWAVADDGLAERPPFAPQMAFNAPVVSPDGRFAAPSGDDGRTHLWNLTNWTAAALEGKTSAARYAPDGRLLALSAGGRLGVGPAADPIGAERKAFSDMPPTDFSPDGRLLAVNKETRVGVWDVSGPEPREFGPPADAGFIPYAMRFTADGRFLLAARAPGGGEPGRFVVYAVTPTGLALRQDAPQFPSTGFALSPDGRAVAFSRTAGGLIACDLADGVVGPPRELKGVPAYWADYSPDGQLLLVGVSTGAQVLNAVTGDVLKDIPFRGAATGGRWHPDGRHAFVNALDRTTYVLRLEPDRWAAEAVLALRGKVRVNGGPTELFEVTELPAGRFALTEVNLNARARVTDEVVAKLAGCRELRTLGLNHSLVTDAGLETIRGYRSLSQVWLDRAKVTAKGVEELAKALPGCRIDWHGGEIRPKK
jgi:WD40 repeat protein/tRNA A-37 threonylcarbamoyl transferase component Bud32